MDTPKVMTREEVIDLVGEYKKIIAPKLGNDVKVYLYGSYSKGNANPWSDIDVAVILPKMDDKKWLETSVSLGKAVNKVSLLIEPVLMTEDHWSPLYDDVMQTGIAI